MFYLRIKGWLNVNAHCSANTVMLKCNSVSHEVQQKEEKKKIPILKIWNVPCIVHALRYQE